MIYAFCWKETLKKYKDPLEERPWRANDVTQAELDGDEDHPCQEYRFPPHPRAKAFEPYPRYHFADSDYVGSEAAREAVEVFCRMMPLYVETLDSEQLELHFLYDDFGAEVAPSDYTTSIAFFIGPCRQRAEVGYPYDEEYGYRRGPNCLEDEDLEVMRLAGPNKRDKLPSISFFVNASGQMIMRTLKWSKTLYDQLKALGASINIIYCCDLPYHSPHVDRFDLGDIMEKPESEWGQHFLNEIQKRAPENYERMSRNLIEAKSNPYWY